LLIPDAYKPKPSSDDFSIALPLKSTSDRMAFKPFFIATGGHVSGNDPLAMA
jgi:hypothetical protein